MTQTTETQIQSYIDALYRAQNKMSDADAIRAVRTLNHLEARLDELRTGHRARGW
jgi:hypothetical protein